MSAYDKLCRMLADSDGDEIGVIEQSLSWLNGSESDAQAEIAALVLVSLSWETMSMR
jgi:hypothetical protein